MYLPSSLLLTIVTDVEIKQQLWMWMKVFVKIAYSMIQEKEMKYKGKELQIISYDQKT